mgnify:CR=1 FL=1
MGVRDLDEGKCRLRLLYCSCKILFGEVIRDSGTETFDGTEKVRVCETFIEF